MSPTLFAGAYFVGLAAGSVIRVVYALRLWRERTADQRKRVRDPLLILPFLGMFVIPLLYGLTPLLKFADYVLPDWAGWGGVAVFAAALWLLDRSHAALGRNWSPTLETRTGQTLVTTGVFRHMRHPMYAAHALWAIAQPLLLQNWVAGWAMLLSSLPVYLLRVPREERMMLDYFGEAYREYMSRTGRIVPRWRQ